MQARIEKNENIFSSELLPAINERVKQLVDYYANGSVKRFSEMIKLSSSQKLNRIFNLDKRNNEYPDVSSDILLSIANKFSEIDKEWLLTGRGSMLKEGPQTQDPPFVTPEVQMIHQPPYTEKIEEQEVILYDVNAAANLKTLFDNKSQNILGRIKIPDMPRCDGAVYVNGDSMYPLLKSGDIIAYKEVHHLNCVIFGEMYLVSFGLDGDEYLTVKYVNKSENQDHIMLVSYNPHHHPMDIPISSINAIALIKFSVRKNTMI